MKARVNPRLVSLVAASVLMTSWAWVNAQQRNGATVAIDADDIAQWCPRERFNAWVKATKTSVWRLSRQLVSRFAR